jgi:hypothetical protein
LTDLNELVAVAARFCLGSVFAVAAVSKLRRRSDLREFRSSVAALLPRFARRLPRVPEAVLVLECAVAVLLLAPGLAPVGFGVAIVLLTAFAAGAAAAWLRGTRTPCRCFGSSSAPLGRRHVVRNLLLVGIATGGLLAGTPSHNTDLVVSVAAAVVGVSSALVFVFLDDLIEVLVPTRTLETKELS